MLSVTNADGWKAKNTSPQRFLSFLLGVKRKVKIEIYRQANENCLKGDSFLLGTFLRLVLTHFFHKQIQKTLICGCTQNAYKPNNVY